jgi:vacuolar protein sorting-associated protein IST1
MAVHRFQMASNKKSALLKQSMREVAILLAEDPPKEEKARITAEALIRDDYMIEAFDILSLTCELLSERLKLISFTKECPPDLIASVATLMYAAPRVDIPELQFIRKQFRAKYGKKFEEDAMSNVGGVLNERVVTKLSVEPPAAYLVQTYLERSCEKYEVDWSPSVRLNVSQMGEPMAPPSGFSVPIARGTGLGPVVATTGTTIVGDEELTYDATAHLEPPKAPTSFSNGGGSAANNDDFAEPDIFIPAAPGQSQASSKKSEVSSKSASAPSAPPSAPSAPSVSSANPSSKSSNDDDDKDDSNPPSSSSGPGGPTGSSYQDLAARFDSLKNL